MPDSLRKTNVELGEFPFPLQPEESRYLTWLRNHANYMAVHRMSDYARAVAVLLRGIFINFIVALPVLIVIAIMIGGWHSIQQVSGLNVTLPVILLVAAFFLLFPLLTPIWRIMRHRKQLAVGSDSTVKTRDRLERLFGALLVLFLTVAAFESLTWLLERFRTWEGLNKAQTAAFGAGALALFTAADKLLTILGGFAKKLVMLAVGLIGLIVPLWVVLWIANFLVYEPPQFYWITHTETMVIAFIVFVVLAIIVGIVFRGLRFTDIAKAYGWSLVLAFLLGIVFIMQDEAVNQYSTGYEEELGKMTYEYLGPDEQSEIEEELSELTYEDLGPDEPSAIPDTEDPQEASKRSKQDEKARLRGHAADDTHHPNLRYLRKHLNRSRQAAESFDREISWSAFPDDAPPAVKDLFEARTVSPDLTALLYAIAQGEASIDVEWLNDLKERVELLLGMALYHYVDRHDPNTKASLSYAPEKFAQALAQLNPQEIRALSRHVQGCKQEWDWYFNPYCQAQLWLNNTSALMFAAYAELAAPAVYLDDEFPMLHREPQALEVRTSGFVTNSLQIFTFALVLALLTWFTVDINLTSIHGLYRDRLASAFLVGADTKGDVDIEKDLDLAEICRHEAGSTAPYHLINTALNLQGSKELRVRDRKSDFFLFSKKFIGGELTKYCRSETMELVYPQMDLATAMAISAAAASPNMGRATSPALVATMTLLNIRLGYWIPNPRHVESWLFKHKGEGGKEDGYTFDEVFRDELVEVTRRWEQLGIPIRDPEERDDDTAYLDNQRWGLSTSPNDAGRPSPVHGLVGIGYSGGGIRSATVNLGITQALHERGLFDHFDYMSTVSGGGYLGSSISALMRRKRRTTTEIAGRITRVVAIDGSGLETEIHGPDDGKALEPRDKIIIRVESRKGVAKEYRYAGYAKVAVRAGQKVRVGQRLIHAGLPPAKEQESFAGVFRWRVRPTAWFREILGKLDDRHRWVNVSDGGHIENLAGIELLRRRCKYIVICDSEADPKHHFNGLATLIRSARIDLGVHIDINLDNLRLDENGLSKAHYAFGCIHYPPPDDREKGYLLYLKSSLTGKEDELIQEYHNAHPTFPHESTADQMFSEGQFEAYRSLGEQIGRQVLVSAGPRLDDEDLDSWSYRDLETWFYHFFNQYMQNRMELIEEAARETELVKDSIQDNSDFTGSGKLAP